MQKSVARIYVTYSIYKAFIWSTDRSNEIVLFSKGAVFVGPICKLVTIFVISYKTFVCNKIKIDGVTKEDL